MSPVAIRRYDTAGKKKSARFRLGGTLRLSGSVVIVADTRAIPEQEMWFWNDPKAVAGLRRARAQLAKGQRVYVGDFSEFAHDPDE